MALTRDERYHIYERNLTAKTITSGVISSGFYSFENGYCPNRGSMLKRHSCYKSNVGDVWINPKQMCDISTKEEKFLYAEQRLKNLAIIQGTPIEKPKPKGKRYLPMVSQKDRKIQRILDLMQAGKTNWEIRQITGSSFKFVKRVMDDAQILGIVRWNDKFNPYIINKERRVFIETFYMDFNKCGYSIADLIECYKKKFRGYDVMKNTVRNIIKKKGFFYYNTKWNPPNSSGKKPPTANELTKGASALLHMLSSDHSYLVVIDQIEFLDDKIPSHVWCRKEDLEKLKGVTHRAGKFYIDLAIDMFGIVAWTIYRSNVATSEMAIFIHSIVMAFKNIDNAPINPINQMRVTFLQFAKLQIYQDQGPWQKPKNLNQILGYNGTYYVAERNTPQYSPIELLNNTIARRVRKRLMFLPSDQKMEWILDCLKNEADKPCVNYYFKCLNKARYYLNI